MSPAPDARPRRPRRVPSVGPRQDSASSGRAIALTGAVLAASVTACALLTAACLELAGRDALAVDSAVGVLVLGAGAGAAAWTSWWLLLAACCLVAAHVGNRRVRLERVTLALAPAVVRRILATALGASIALGALPAHAQDASPVADIGWQITSAPLAPGTSATPHSATEDPLEEAPSRALAPAARHAGKSARSSTPATSRPSTTTTRPAAQHARQADAGPARAAATQTSGQTDTGPARAAATAGARTVTVRAGDTLWSLAGAELGPGATDAEVAATWPLWHVANRDVLADNPHLIRPGDVLTIPSSTDNAARG